MDIIPLPTPSQRKATFWHFKHSSSYTCWSRICEAYEELLGRVQKLADPSHGKHAFPLNELDRARWASEEMYKALARLHAGDRACCFGNTESPNFRAAAKPVNDWFWIYNEGRYGPGHIGPSYMSYASYWPELCGYLIECLAEWNFGSRALKRYRPQPPHAPYRPHKTSFKRPDHQFSDATQFRFGQDIPVMDPTLRWYHDHIDRFHDVPSPPQGEMLRIIRSEVPIPTTGIWEPFRCSPEALERRLKENPDDWNLWGLPCKPDLFNYLHQGVPAPTYKRWDDEQEDWIFERVTWLLVWEDDRYGEQGIPEGEEQLYPHLPRAHGMRLNRAQFEEELRKGGFD